MAFGDEDLDVFFQDGSVAELADGTTFGCHFDIPEHVDVFQPINSRAGVVMARPEIRYKTASAPGLKHGDAVKVNGTQYKVSGAPRKEGDGLVSVAGIANG
jgi:hypothetical protein